MDDLLRELLGDAVEGLAPNVRLAHSPPLKAMGQFQIESRPIARFWGLPKAGERVDVEVQVSNEGGVQVWRRRFGHRTVTTRQQVRNGLLIERKGLSRIGMRLTPHEDVLRYVTVRAWLGPFRIPLAFCPAVEAEVSETPEGWRVDVVVRVGFLGAICRYWGNMTMQ